MSFRTWVVEQKVAEGSWAVLFEELSSREAREASQSLNFALPDRYFRYREVSDPAGGAAGDGDEVKALAERIYAAGRGVEWLPTADGTPNVFSYEVARQLLRNPALMVTR